MGIVTRYFDTADAGAADGTTWADRAALFSAGNWSTIITGFNFSGADALKALIGSGSHVCSQALASGLFANAPTVANPLILHGCNSSGVQLTPPVPNWTSDRPVTWDSVLPGIGTTTNINTINLNNCICRLLKFTASGTTSAPPLSAALLLDWCSLEHSGVGTATLGINNLILASRNCSVKMSGTSYRCGLLWAGDAPTNCRIEGVTGTSGNRHGVEFSGTANPTPLSRCTIFNHGGDGVGSISATASHRYLVQRCIIANNGGTGLKMNATVAQTNNHLISGCMITGNGAWGIDGQAGAARAVVAHNRLRDNASGSITGLGNYPTDLDNDTTAATDADDYVDAPGGDFRIKATAAIAGQDFGVSSEVALSSIRPIVFLLRPFNMSRGRGR